MANASIALQPARELFDRPQVVLTRLQALSGNVQLADRALDAGWRELTDPRRDELADDRLDALLHVTDLLCGDALRVQVRLPLGDVIREWTALFDCEGIGSRVDHALPP
ncbi:MAG TPA: hypothetical protein PKC49_01255 [Phycisphaerae bacterium]|nr:hypothetical protein [Phycisphaerae bacterium]